MWIEAKIGTLAARRLAPTQGSPAARVLRFAWAGVASRPLVPPVGSLRRAAAVRGKPNLAIEWSRPRRQCKTNNRNSLSYDADFAVAIFLLNATDTSGSSLRSCLRRLKSSRSLKSPRFFKRAMTCAISSTYILSSSVAGVPMFKSLRHPRSRLGVLKRNLKKVRLSKKGILLFACYLVGQIPRVYTWVKGTRCRQKPNVLGFFRRKCRHLLVSFEQGLYSIVAGT
jgi:hypothetical protein